MFIAAIDDEIIASLRGILAKRINQPCREMILKYC